MTFATRNEKGRRRRDLRVVEPVQGVAIRKARGRLGARDVLLLEELVRTFTAKLARGALR